MSNADTTTQSSDTKPQQLDTSGEVQPKVGDGTKGLHLDASVDNSDQPKVVRWEDSIEYFRAVDYQDPKDYLHAKIDWHEKELARLARELGRERRSSELRHRTIEVLKTERAGLKGGIVGRDDRYKALEQRLSVEKKRIVRIRAERDKLAAELAACREAGREVTHNPTYEQLAERVPYPGAVERFRDYVERGTMLRNHREMLQAVLAERDKLKEQLEEAQELIYAYQSVGWPHPTEIEAERDKLAERVKELEKQLRLNNEIRTDHDNQLFTARSERDKLAGELEVCRELSRDRQQRALDAEDEVGTLAERVKELEGEDWRHYAKKNVRLVTRVNRLEAENARLREALERIEGEAAASWIADVASQVLRGEE